jgi:hypothetical protein
MTTVRQIERQWNANDYVRLLRDMLSIRPEASLRLESELSGPIPAAAMALLRLDELALAYVPLYARLLRFILQSQDPDGGWGDPLTTALCLRALLAGRGQGVAINRGMEYLGQMQKPEGVWPKVPIRRTTADAFVSAFILLQLGGESRFRGAVRFDDATEWFDAHAHSLDAETARLWDCARRRTGTHRVSHREPQGVLSWS